MCVAIDEFLDILGGTLNKSEYLICGTHYSYDSFQM